MPSALAAALAVLTLAAAPESPVPAGPSPTGPVLQYNASLVVLGGAFHDERGWSGGAQVGVRPELVFGRTGGASLGAGPYLEGSAHLSSRGVGGLFGGGASLLVPTGSANALVPSVGGYGSLGELGLQPGLCAGLFFGARQFNAQSHWDGAWGLRLDLRYGLGAAHEAMATLGLQVDLSLAAFLLSWVFQ